MDLFILSSAITSLSVQVNFLARSINYPEHVLQRFVLSEFQFGWSSSQPSWTGISHEYITAYVDWFRWCRGLSLDVQLERWNRHFSQRSMDSARLRERSFRLPGIQELILCNFLLDLLFVYTYIYYVQLSIYPNIRGIFRWVCKRFLLVVIHQSEVTNQPTCSIVNAEIFPRIQWSRQTHERNFTLDVFFQLLCFNWKWSYVRAFEWHYAHLNGKQQEKQKNGAKAI